MENKHHPWACAWTRHSTHRRRREAVGGLPEHRRPPELELRPRRQRQPCKSESMSSSLSISQQSYKSSDKWQQPLVFVCYNSAYPLSCCSTAAGAAAAAVARTLTEELRRLVTRTPARVGCRWIAEVAPVPLLKRLQEESVAIDPFVVVVLDRSIDCCLQLACCEIVAELAAGRRDSYKDPVDGCVGGRVWWGGGNDGQGGSGLDDMPRHCPLGCLIFFSFFFPLLAAGKRHKAKLWLSRVKISAPASTGHWSKLTAPKISSLYLSFFTWCLGVFFFSVFYSVHLW